jgi:hypothetical protein
LPDNGFLEDLFAVFRMNAQKINVPYFSPAHARRGDGPKKIWKALTAFRYAFFPFRYVCTKRTGKGLNYLQTGRRDLRWSLRERPIQFKLQRLHSLGG